MISDHQAPGTGHQAPAKLADGTSFVVNNFRVSGFQGFRVSGFQGFRVSGFQGFRVSVNNITITKHKKLIKTSPGF